MESLVQRLVQNPHDQEAITFAHQAGQSDPRSYAMLLEQVGKSTQDPAFASHWLTEAANVWSTSLGDAHRAARALMIAIDRDPTQPTPAERLAELYREKGDMKALVALLDRRGKALTALAQQSPEIAPHAAAVYEELGRLWAEEPLNQPRKAVDNYRRAVQFDPANQYAIYGLRELYKSQGQWLEAIPLFELEQRMVTDAERQLALYQDEAEVRRNAGDLAGSSQTLRAARSVEGGADPTLKQQLATSVLERVQAGEQVHPQETAEAAQLFVELAEEYPGEHGFSYSVCALDLEATHDRAVQLAMYYGEQLGREAEAAPRAAAYLKANPQGALAPQARELVNKMMELGGDESLLEALAPPPDADASQRVAALLDIAKGLARKAKKREAADRYREVTSIEPANEEAVTFLEAYLRQTRKYSELKDLLLAAASSQDADVELRGKWIREVAELCESQLRDLDGSIAAWKLLIDLDPSDEGPMDQLTRLLERAKRWDDLCQLLQQKAEQTDDIEARLSIEKSVAKIHEQRRKDPVATGEAWARIAALVPDDDDAINTAVRFFEKGERPDLAAQVIADNMASVTDEESRGALSERLGVLCEAAGQHQRAGEAFAEAAALLKQASLWEASERCFVAAELWEQAASAVSERAQLTGESTEQAALYALESDYLGRAGDAAAALERLEQATDLDPEHESYAAALEQRYVAEAKHKELAAYLLRRADKLANKTLRTSLRKRAAQIQKEQLGDADAARDSLVQVLEDTDDPEALGLLLDDAEASLEWSAAAEYAARLSKAVTEPSERIKVALREARIVAQGLEDRPTAIERYESILSDFEENNEEALIAIADLHEAEKNPAGTVDALERLLKASTENPQKLSLARRLADIYEGPLESLDDAVRTLEIVRDVDDEDYDALQRLCDLSERLEDWPRVAEYLAGLIDVEGDDDEVSKMTRRLAEILDQRVGKGDEALAALMTVADGGDEACRNEYVKLGDKLGWKGIVATKLVEWYIEAPGGDERNEALRGAFERFVEVGRDSDAANVAKELIRTKGADVDLADKLEAIAVKLKDLEALEIAHDLKVQDLSGPTRAEEMVRQAEVMAEAGVEAEEAIQHGEQALTSVPPEEVESLLSRLAALAKAPGHVIDLYERQVTRCKSPQDRLRALARAAQVAAEHDALDRARQFFDISLGGGVQEETLTVLEDIARIADVGRDGKVLTKTLAQALAAGGQGSRDGGRTRSALLGRAAQIAHADLEDTDQAFAWLGDALVTHVDDTRLDELERLAEEVGDPKRAATVLNRALEEVFDGPLVRKLLARRARVRREKLGDPRGAAEDLKRLHDLSPSDTAVMDELANLYTELEDYRGMVQLYEDQILRGKDTATRAELARKVARLWEDQLADPREAADAWRRVLRMKSGDPEAQEGLERAKSLMLKSSGSESASEKKGRPDAKRPRPFTRSSAPLPASDEAPTLPDDVAGDGSSLGAASELPLDEAPGASDEPAADEDPLRALTDAERPLDEPPLSDQAPPLPPLQDDEDAASPLPPDTDDTEDALPPPEAEAEPPMASDFPPVPVTDQTLESDAPPPLPFAAEPEPEPEPEPAPLDGGDADTTDTDSTDTAGSVDNDDDDEPPDVGDEVEDDVGDEVEDDADDEPLAAAGPPPLPASGASAAPPPPPSSRTSSVPPPLPSAAGLSAPTASSPSRPLPPPPSRPPTPPPSRSQAPLPAGSGRPPPPPPPRRPPGMTSSIPGRPPPPPPARSSRRPPPPVPAKAGVADSDDIDVSVNEDELQE